MMCFKLTHIIKKMVIHLLFIATFIVFTSPVYAQNEKILDIVIVVNTLDKNLSLSKQQIRHIYMGGAISRQFKAVNLPAGNPLRVNFNTRMVGLTESRIQAYWAQMRFTGRSKPPIEFESAKEIIEYLLKEEDSVAYLPVDTAIPDGLTILSFN